MGLPQPTFADDFEHGLVGTYSAYTGFWDGAAGAPSIVTDVVRTGARALRLSPSAASEYISATTAATTVTQAVYVRFASLPTALSYLLTFVNASGSAQVSYDQISGKFGIRGTNLPATNGGPVISAGVWYRIVAEYDTSGATAVMRVSVDGEEITASVAQTSAATTAARLGTGANHTYTCYYDDWVVSQTDGDYEALVLAGSHAVVNLLPSSDGTHNVSGANQFEYSGSGADITNSSTDVYTLVADVPMDMTLAAYVNQVGAGSTNYVEVNFDALPTGGEAVARVMGRATTRDAAATGKAYGVIRVVLSGDGVGDIRAAADDPGTTAWTRYLWLTHPTAGIFRRDEVNALRCRMGYGDGAPDWYALSVNLMAVLVPEAVGPAAVALTPTVPAPELQQGTSEQTVSPSALGLTCMPVAPTLETSVQMGSLGLSVTLPAPSIEQVAAPPSLGLALTAPAPEVQQGASTQTVSAPSLTLAIALGAPSIAPSVQMGSLGMTATGSAPRVDQTTGPSPLALAFAVVQPGVAQSIGAATIALAMGVPGPGVTSSVQTPSMGLAASAPAPLIQGVGTQAVSPPSIEIEANVFAPAITSSLQAPAAATLTVSIAPPEIHSALLPAELVMSLTLGPPGFLQNLVVGASALAASLMMLPPVITSGRGAPGTGVAMTTVRGRAVTVAASPVCAMADDRTREGGVTGG